MTLQLAKKIDILLMSEARKNYLKKCETHVINPIHYLSFAKGKKWVEAIDLLNEEASKIERVK